MDLREGTAVRRKSTSIDTVMISYIVISRATLARAPLQNYSGVTRYTHSHVGSYMHMYTNLTVNC